MSNNRGFSLVELVVAMAAFIVIMLVISSAFETIVSKGGQQVKSAETNTEGIIGLEMFRADLEHAGFGLPWTYPVAPNPAITETSGDTGVSGITYADLEDTDAPRAILVQASATTDMIINDSATTNPLTAYLVIKSTRVALSDTAQKWAHVNYSSQGTANKSYIKKWQTSDDFAAQDRVITIHSTFTPSSGLPDRRLVTGSSSPNYYYSITNTTHPIHPPADAYKPGDASQLFSVYGVDPGNDLRMPYNRADYYIKKTAGRPESCNPGTGILFKGVVRQGTTSPGGTFIEYPLLNCVGDMQVEFELDTAGNGNITYSNSLAGMSADRIRSELKNVRVFILAHEGKKDRNYTYPDDSIKVGDASRPASSGRTLDSTWLAEKFGPEWRNYRWKVYTIAVRPKNLKE